MKLVFDQGAAYCPISLDSAHRNPTLTMNQEDLQALEKIYLEVESQVEKFRAILDALIDQVQLQPRRQTIKKSLLQIVNSMIALPGLRMADQSNGAALSKVDKLKPEQVLEFATDGGGIEGCVEYAHPLRFKMVIFTAASSQYTLFGGNTGNTLVKYEGGAQSSLDEWLLPLLQH